MRLSSRCAWGFPHPVAWEDAKVMSSRRPLLPHLRRMVHVGPYGGELPVALRAAASVAVPMLVLWATGHLEWSLYATFGAFTSLFGRTVPIRPRLVMQVQAGAVLVASVLVGTLIAVLASAVPGTGWVVVPVAHSTSIGTATDAAARSATGSSPPYGPTCSIRRRWGSGEREFMTFASSHAAGVGITHGAARRTAGWCADRRLTSMDA